MIELLENARANRRYLVNFHHVAVKDPATGYKKYKRHESSTPEEEIVEREVKLGAVELFIVNPDNDTAQRVVLDAYDIINLAIQLQAIEKREVPPIPLEDIDY